MTFQFPTGSDGYPSTAEEDLKKEGHYMKSLIALLSSGVDRVALPMTCLVQHLVRLQLLLTVRTTARDQQLGLLTLLSWTCAGFCSAGELKCALRPSGPGLRYSWAFHQRLTIRDLRVHLAVSPSLTLASGHFPQGRKKARTSRTPVRLGEP